MALDPGLLLSQYQKRQWRVEDGLPHNYVMAVLPDPDGYLLVGTDEGLARFDGVHFIPYDLQPTLGLSKRWVLSMIAAHDGSLWIGTFDGGLYQCRAGQVITRVEKGASVFAILEDSDGRIWASTRSAVIRGTSLGRGIDHRPDALLRKHRIELWPIGFAVDQVGRQRFDVVWLQRILSPEHHGAPTIVQPVSGLRQ
jgi:ligand-binding sensor domain-containing protein